jgi:hypothetical protein
MRVHAHIGFHKTGTTAIQSLIAGNSHRFPSGVKVITRDSSETYQLRRALRLFNLKGSSIDGEAIRANFKKLIETNAAQGITQLLITSAGISGSIPDILSPVTPYRRVPEAVQLICSTVELPHELTFSASARNEMNWIDSLYRHHVRNRGIREGLDAIKHCRIAEFRFDSLISELRVINPELFVFRMEDDADHRLGVGYSLLRHLGLTEVDLQGWVAPAEVNKGISQRTIDALSSRSFRYMPKFLRSRYAKWHSKRNRESQA